MADGKASLVEEKGWQGNINVTQAVGLKCGTIDFRFPTYEEYRWNVFSAIASAGARGTANWIYSHSEGSCLIHEAIALCPTCQSSTLARIR
tara:strand:+ start:36 stop:308 length:273 start_codon:yes stop_codon:yes gene_type:complete